MNRYSLFIPVCLLASVFAHAADTLRSNTQTRVVAATQIFVPPGFDDSDNVQVIIHGSLFTCYKMAAPLVHIDLPNQTVYVAANAYPTGGNCWSDVVVPFDQIVDVGRLPAGNYQVIQVAPKGSANLQATLTVAAFSANSVDDNLFASVSQSFVDTTMTPPMIHVIGTLPSSCLYLSEVRVHHRAAHIVEVLPILARTPGKDCLPTSIRFDVTSPLPTIEPGPWLLYTRSINGQALSAVQTF